MAPAKRESETFPKKNQKSPAPHVLAVVPSPKMMLRCASLKSASTPAASPTPTTVLTHKAPTRHSGVIPTSSDHHQQRPSTFAHNSPSSLLVSCCRLSGGLVPFGHSAPSQSLFQRHQVWRQVVMLSLPSLPVPTMSGNTRMLDGGGTSTGSCLSLACSSSVALSHSLSLQPSRELLSNPRFSFELSRQTCIMGVVSSCIALAFQLLPFVEASLRSFQYCLIYPPPFTTRPCHQSKSILNAATPLPLRPPTALLGRDSGPCKLVWRGETMGIWIGWIDSTRHSIRCEDQTPSSPPVCNFQQYNF
ncbi:hypothetical protein BJ508DRAFT_52085 [Ascobolus immersus RN42]|uniref:Uncharacterized protein n=1 Tax=Ascobolus immersus RN42 TaxID=1160509 RepID=A0A3N4ICP5_ASCIM|nr:hypothetical protein BJ508DRAFT_52085 [Ascobolus immersus RN42]